jgi:hypothetical protein
MQNVKLTLSQLEALLQHGKIMSGVEFWSVELANDWEFKYLSSGIWLRPVVWDNMYSNGIFLGKTHTEATEAFKNL